MRHDRLYDVKWALLRHASFAWIDSMDRLKMRHPADVVMATAVCLILICQRFGLEPRRVMDTADRVLRRAKDVTPQYPRAIEHWLKEEFSDE